VWETRAISFFSILMAIFTAGVSIPADIEEKRMHMLASKPVHKRILFLGKYLGLIIMNVAFIFIMGVIAIIYLRIIQLNSTMSLVAKPKITASEIIPKNNGKIKIVKDKKQYILSGDQQDDEVIWRFDDISQSKFPKNIEIEVKLDIQEYNPYTKEIRYDVYTGDVNVIVYNLEKEILNKNCFIMTNSPYKISIPTSSLKTSPTFFVKIKRVNPLNIIVLDEDSVTFYGASQIFEVNCLKGFLLIFLPTFIVLTTSLVASSFLSASVSIFFGLFVFFCGSMYGFIAKALPTVDTTIAIQERAEKQIATGQFRKNYSYHYAEIPIWVLKISKHISWGMLKIIPDFNDFDFCNKYLLNDLALPLAVLFHKLCYAMTFVVTMLIIGLVLITFRDFG